MNTLLFIYCVFPPCAPRFVSEMPTTTLFIAFSLVLRMVEGIGTAMYSTASYTLLTQLYPNKKGTIVVSQECMTTSSSPRWLDEQGPRRDPRWHLDSSRQPQTGQTGPKLAPEAHNKDDVIVQS